MSTDNTSTTTPEMVECAWTNCDTKFIPIPRTKMYCSARHQLYGYRARIRADNIAAGLTSKGEPRQRTTNHVSSVWIAERTGFSKSGIGLMRKPGARDASIQIPRFEKFEKAFNWSVDDQIDAARDGRWAEEMEKVAAAAYAKENDRG